MHLCKGQDRSCSWYIHSQNISGSFLLSCSGHIMSFVEIAIHIIPAPLRKVTSPSDLLAELFLDPDLTQFSKNGTGAFKNSISLLTGLMEISNFGSYISSTWNKDQRDTLAVRQWQEAIVGCGERLFTGTAVLAKISLSIVRTVAQ